MADILVCFFFLALSTNLAFSRLKANVANSSLFCFSLAFCQSSHEKVSVLAN